MASTKSKSVILDVDVGSDDAWAILLALNNENKVNFKVRAITCTFGNSSVDHVGKNVLRVLETVNRLDIPVYLGSNEPLIIHGSKNGEKETTFHGIDGLCDVGHAFEPDKTLIRKEHAVKAMQKMIMEDDHVHLICLGPLTNVALLFKMHPSVRDKIREITIMGGNRHGVGNITRAAEFNFHCDPEAAFVVLQTAKCPIRLLPLETIRLSKPISKEWRFEVLGSVDNKVTRFFNPIERKAFDKREFWTPFDAYAVASFIAPDLIKRTDDFHMTIELGGFFTRGQVVIDHIDRIGYKNVTVIEEIDVEKFKELLLTMVSEAPKY